VSAQVEVHFIGGSTVKAYESASPCRLMPSFICVLILCSALAFGSASAAQPHDSSTTNRIAAIDDEGRVSLSGRSYLFYGAKIPAGHCAVASARVPCARIALAVVRATLVGELLEYETVAMSGGRLSIRSPEITDLVRLGWLIDDPSESNGVYREADAQARANRAGIWAIRVGE
jgi:hypothetical protein